MKPVGLKVVQKAGLKARRKAVLNVGKKSGADVDQGVGVTAGDKAGVKSEINVDQEPTDEEKVGLKNQFSVDRGVRLNKKERARFVSQRLKELYPETPIPLDHKDPYTLLVAVLLSAQCTDVRVNQVTPELFRLADTPREMATKSVSEVQKIIRPCGLSEKKAQAIVELSRILVEKFNGQVPADLEALEGLPGVGHKTASVVMAQAFGVPAFPVDTHIHRLSQLWGLSNGKSVVQTERDLKSLFPKEEWNALHLRIIYYGREHCQARTCRGLKCEICRHLYPTRKKPVATRK